MAKDSRNRIIKDINVSALNASKHRKGKGVLFAPYEGAVNSIVLCLPFLRLQPEPSHMR